MTRFLLTNSLFLVALSLISPVQGQEKPTQTVSQIGAQTGALKFDFGTGLAAPGYRAVAPDARYSAKAGFGFEGDARISAQNQSGPDKLRRDFCTGDGPFFFSAAVPEGNYDVTVVLGDQKAASDTTIKAEARRLIASGVKTAPGEFQKLSFSVAVKRPVLQSGRSVVLKAAQSPLDWDDRLTLEFNGPRPCVCAVEIVPAPSVSTVFLAGDSTVTDQGSEPFTGWGQMLPRFFGRGAAVFNNAESGETLASFAAGNRFQKIWESAKPGDTLLIQFGHNDQKEKGEGALDHYKAGLKTAIAEARARGIVPVLVTPMERRIWKEGVLVPTLLPNAIATREVAAAEKVALIDLNAASVQFITALGEAGSKIAFVHYPANTFPGQVKALRDDSHFSAYGAFELARIVADGIRAQKLDVARFLKTDLAPFDPLHPDDVQALALPSSPLQALVRPAGS